MITENLCTDCKLHFEEVKSYLNDLKVEYFVDSKLVRGLDYYTKTAFEIISGELGAQNAIAGGGRYDDLIEELGGKSTPAVGFAAGMERMIIALDQQRIEWPKNRVLDVYVVRVNEKNKDIAFELLQK
jgi:histidyl-tRNA synthetase (EC 6.1.1.21)